MKVIFFGTSSFAVPPLEKLAESPHEVRAVVTQIDRPKGRGRRPLPVPVKVAAEGNNLCLYQPSRPEDLLEQLKTLMPDLLVVVSYGHILKPELLKVTPQGAINLHASLLPAYRGAAPVNWALINGQTRTGISVIKINEFVDRGPIIIQEETGILDDDNALTLSDRLSRQGANLLLRAIDLIEKGKVKFIPQDETKATYAPKLKKEDGLINWHGSAIDIRNRIRGLVPWPGGWTFHKKKILKIWKTELSQTGGQDLPLLSPGTVVNLDRDKGIMVQTGKGMLVITQLQLEGKRRIAAAEFVTGRQIDTGDVLGDR